MKFPECETCYFHNREPAICDECEDADQYEPEEGEEGAAELLRKMMSPGCKIISIKARFTEEQVKEAEEQALKEAA